MSHARFDEQGFETDSLAVAWGEVLTVGLRTTSDGPFAEDLFWQFALADRLIELPGSCLQGSALAVVFGALPGIDLRKVVAAMGSTEDRQFRVWERREPPRPELASLHARFGDLLGRLGAVGDPAPFGDRLLAAWSEPARRYHDTEHLAECLSTLDRAAPAGPERDLAELALWYHDAVYDPRERDNEARSAAWLESDGAQLSLEPALTARAARLVRATAHGSASPEGDPLAALVCDVDLAILGREPLRFFEFEDSVREEYAHVGSIAFALGRGRFLASLLRQPRIYVTPWAHDAFEEAARRNVAALLALPRYTAWRLLRWAPGVAPR
jgi:predicted metal-dependent HD superfamily phosphohydrolase